MDKILHNKPPFHNLHTILTTIAKINNWLDSDSSVVPKEDELMLMAKYFDCIVDYLLDLSFKR